MDIKLEADMSIEPGHQVIVLPGTTEGSALAILLNGAENNWTLRVRHTADVDARIVALIDALAHVRFSAPGLVQLTMEEGGQQSADSNQPSAVSGQRENVG